MIKDALAAGETSPMTLRFGVRHEADHLYRDDLEALEKQYPNVRALYIVSQPGPDWQGLRGYVQTHAAKRWREPETQGAPQCTSAGWGMVGDRKQVHSERYDGDSRHWHDTCLGRSIMARLSLSVLRAIVRAVAIAGPPALSVACGGQTVGSSHDDSRGADGTAGTSSGGPSGSAYSQQSKSTEVPLQVECYAPDAGASDAADGGETTEGGPLDGGADGDAGLTCRTLSCEEQCGSTLLANTSIWMFHLVNCDLPGPGTNRETVTCHWQSPPAGRRPSDIRVPSAVQARSEVGAYLAASAFLEEASIGAFLGLERELRAHGAPPSLTRRARAAARDEARHTRVLGALARGAGATPPRPQRQPHVIRDLETLAIENAVEGCVREAYGALVALWQSERASDPAIRSAMAEIAVEETRHAELALDSGAWMATLLDEGARARVALALRTAVKDLRADAATIPPPALVSTLGLPTSAEAGLLVDALASALLSIPHDRVPLTR